MIKTNEYHGERSVREKCREDEQKSQRESSSNKKIFP